MAVHEWLSTPIGIDGDRLVTRTGCRTVLVVVHTLVAAHRLLDVVDQVETDPRVQVIFAVAPDEFNRTVRPLLDALGALTIPWDQAVRQRFDVALAASYTGLADLHAPVVLMAHGAGHGKYLTRRERGGPPVAGRIVYGLDAQRLTFDGRVVPTRILLAHDSELEIQRHQCPDATAVTTVVGDPCLDRLVCSEPVRPDYRAAVGVEPDQSLVVVCSTWGPRGLFGQVPDLLPKLLDQLPAERFRVAALLHPAVWTAHGSRQVRAWLRDCTDAGLVLPDPTEDWRPYIVAADQVIGDHGSVTAYAAALGRSVLLATDAGSELTTPGSAQRMVATTAGRLDPERPLHPQIRAVGPLDRRTVLAALTSRPGRAAQLIRGEIYRLLRLPEPRRAPRVIPVPPPRDAVTPAP